MRDSDSFFDNGIESDAEQTLISANVDARARILPMASTSLMTFQIGHADKSGERRDIDDGFDPLHGASRREHRLRSGIAALRGRDGCRQPSIQVRVWSGGAESDTAIGSAWAC